MDDVDSAREMAQRLRSDYDFYTDCKIKAKRNYKQFYEIEKWKKQMHNTL